MWLSNVLFEIVIILIKDELMNELEELEQEGLDEQLLEVGGTADLPSVPATELPAAPG